MDRSKVLWNQLVLILELHHYLSDHAFLSSLQKELAGDDLEESCGG